MICPECGEWQEPVVDSRAGLGCSLCGYLITSTFPPLFILTGPSGGGKSAVLPALRACLPEWEIFETDLLWDSAGDWQMVRRNWLRIAYSVITEGRRPVILAGVHVPESIDQCPERCYFGEIHYAALVCAEVELTQRLQARPKWRGATEAFVAGQLDFMRWLSENSETAFHPALGLIDTSDRTVEVTAKEIASWARGVWGRKA